MSERRPIADGGGGTRYHCCDARVPPGRAAVRLVYSDRTGAEEFRS
jgi:hypothetical protein